MQSSPLKPEYLERAEATLDELLVDPELTVCSRFLPFFSCRRTLTSGPSTEQQGRGRTSPMAQARLPPAAQRQRCSDHRRFVLSRR